MRLKFTEERITPQRAKELLEANRENRQLQKRQIAELAGQIEGGRWLLTHQGIAFDTNGRLVDGQHRLKAIVLANKPAELVVCRGLDPAAFPVVDQGRARSIADQARQDKRVVAIVNVLVETIARTRLRMTTDLLDRSLDAYGPQIERVFGGSSARRATAAVRAGFALRLAREPNRADHLLAQLQRWILNEQGMTPQLWALRKRVDVDSMSGLETLTRIYAALDPKREHQARAVHLDMNAVTEDIQRLHARVAPDFYLHVVNLTRTLARMNLALRRGQESVAEDETPPPDDHRPDSVPEPPSRPPLAAPPPFLI